MLGYAWPGLVSYPEMDPEYVASSLFTEVHSLRYLSLSLSDENHTDYWVHSTPLDPLDCPTKAVSEIEFEECRVKERMNGASRYTLDFER